MELMVISAAAILVLEREGRRPGLRADMRPCRNSHVLHSPSPLLNHCFSTISFPD
jgi:hypothetical protein